MSKEEVLVQIPSRGLAKGLKLLNEIDTGSTCVIVKSVSLRDAPALFEVLHHGGWRADIDNKMRLQKLVRGDTVMAILESLVMELDDSDQPADDWLLVDLEMYSDVLEDLGRQVGGNLLDTTLDVANSVRTQVADYKDRSLSSTSVMCWAERCGLIKEQIVMKRDKEIILHDSEDTEAGCSMDHNADSEDRASDGGVGDSGGEYTGADAGAEGAPDGGAELIM